MRGRACVGRLKEPAKRRARPSPLAASSAARPEVDLRSGYSKEAPRRGRAAGREVVDAPRAFPRPKKLKYFGKILSLWQKYILLQATLI